MPARLHFSNSLDALAERLIEGLARADDPLSAPVIATPGAAMRDWLKVRIAEKTGVAAGIAFPPLENLLWDQLAQRDRHRENPERLPARLLDPLSLQGLVMSRLRHDPPAPLRAYLDSSHPEDAARRLVQLAGRLASLFREYEYNRVAERGRPGLTGSWMRGLPIFGPRMRRAAVGDPRRFEEVRELEEWQMDVYRSLFREGDGLRDLWGAATKTYRYTLPQYAGMALADPVAPPDASRTYHLFGLSNISPFHRDLIGQLADAERLGAAAGDFEIYALNPCAEYWEDALTLRERRARGMRPLTAGAIAPDRVAATRPDDDEIERGELRDAEDENGLLALFGKPGRETVKLWCQLTDHDFREDFREPEGDGLLAAVRESVLRRAGAFASRVAPDASLRFRAAATPRDELEAVRDEIADALREDAPPRPEDLAIITADPAATLPLLRAVFSGDDRTPGNVPLLMPDGGGAEEGPLLRGFRALLDLGTGTVTREAVLALLGNPAIRHRAGLDETRGAAFAEFFDLAGFRRGWDGGADDASRLDAALDRAVLSLALDGNDPAVQEDENLPLPLPGLPGGLDREDAGALLDWLDSLRERLAPLRDGTVRTWAEWAGVLRALRDAFLGTRGAARAEDARDAMELQRFLDEMETWGAWAGAGPETVGTTLVTMLFADRFRETESTGRSVFLRGGVRVGTLSALRGIPFRRVWITGMTSAFPASSEAAPLDLRAFRRLPGESDPAARDLYALLETVATCTEAVSLSWHRRDDDGKDRQPSRALTGMMAWLERDVLPPDHPFGFDAMAPRALPPPSAAAHRAVAWARGPAERSHHDFRDVAGFLRNPAMQTIRQLTRRDEGGVFDDAEPMLSEDLFVGRWPERDVLDACLRAELTVPGTAMETFDRAWKALRRGGRVPPSPWEGVEHARLRTTLQSRLDGELAALRAWMDSTGMRFVGSLRLGPQGLERAEAPVTNLPAFDLRDVASDQTGSAPRLGGVLPWFFRGRAGWALRTTPGQESTGYIVQLCAEGLPSLPPRLAEFFSGTGHLITPVKDGASIEALPLTPLDGDLARTRLRDLMSDFVRAQRGGGHLDDVPLEEIAAVLKDADGNPDDVPDWGEAVMDRRGDAEEQGQDRYTRDQRRLRAVAPELPGDLDALVRRRVLPYLEWKTALGSDPAGDTDEDAAAAGGGP